ncbi:hydroxymethylbilane synthase [Helicobacter sp. 16-1353]|uniref:hydroxymethylbilane synthase n=1 Tax=Helicobacter sp. 16-1353 TaxID=2004996 RepID=UPI000DCBFA94|nr:hydroxymethylbilane synthase [Helicobacter sp. 16-1353]RAX54014.1 hydroxymethylbilane synthase [Helicobacter sp. 16-1353]
MSKVVIGSRGSVLALWQANFIKDKLADFGISCEIKIVKTTGDKILDAPLSKIGGKGLFTKELEELLLKREITLAVHSLKDVPVVLPKGLILASITKREDVRDCFLSHKFQDIESLPKGAKVGTTSLRRAMQLKYMRSDLETISLRGNVQTRLKKLHLGEFDAIILAKAGVNRLGISESDVRFITPIGVESMIPAMGQGALGIECRADCAILEVLQKLNDEVASIECGLEREFVRLLDGGCQVPIGVHANYNGDKIELNAVIGLPNGAEIIKDSIIGGRAENLALKLFQKVEKKGVKELLKKAFEMIDFL